MTNVMARSLAGFLFLGLWLTPGASGQLTKLNAAYSAESSWSLATWVAFDAGYFKKYGLDVNLVLIRSAATITSALIAGETPMIQLGGNGTIQAALQGADTVNVLTLVSIIPQSLVVTPDIKTADDLKGKRFGVSRFGALSDLVIRRYLRKFGLDPGKDVTIVQVGGIPELLAAMKAGAISGGSLSPPVLTAAKKAGFKEFGVEQQASIVADYAQQFLRSESRKPANSNSEFYMPVETDNFKMQSLAKLQKVVEDRFPQARKTRLALEAQGKTPPASRPPKFG